MIVLVQARVLLVGIDGKSEVLRDLPVRIIKTDCGTEAACYLKNEKVDAVLCAWDLVDMPNGLFLKKLRIAKPDIKTIVVIKSGSIAQEIAARSLGVSVVITDHADDVLIRETVAETVKPTGLIAHKNAE